METIYRFKCSNCEEWHEGVPGWAWPYPLAYFSVPEDERAARCVLTEDTCIIDDDEYYVRGCLEVPVAGAKEVMVLGVWVSLSLTAFAAFEGVFDESKRAHVGPFFGWLNVPIPTYPDTLNLKTRVHLRDDGVRPYIELEPTDHPLAIEQREGMAQQRVRDLYDRMTFGQQ